MFRCFVALVVLCCLHASAIAQETHVHPPHVHHPDTTSEGWEPLVADDLSNVTGADDVWSFTDGVLTASKDQCLWTKDDFENCVIDLEFKNEDGTNSGVIFYCSDIKNWIPNSVEVQIADDYNEKWGNADPSWRCGAIFGHLPAVWSGVRKPGRWNRMTINCEGQKVSVSLNKHLVTEMDMSLWTSATQNPDGSDIPEWLSTPLAELPTKGKIGLQGKHGDAAIHFRNLRVKKLP